MKVCLAGLLLGALLLASVPAQSQPPVAKLPPLSAAPFTLKTSDGASYRYPADAGGKPVVLMFWPAWCPYSRALQPYLQSVQDDYAAAGVRVWMLSVHQRPEADPATVLRERGLHLPLLLDADTLMPAYRVEYTPWLVVADAQQQVVYTRPPKPPTPIDTARELRVALNGLLGEQAVAIPSTWPRPYEGHLLPDARAPESLFAGQPPALENQRLAPPPLPQGEWAPWVERYLATVPATETLVGWAPRGAISNGRAAIAIAREVWTVAYGEPAVLAQAPYRAYRMDNQWIVLGAPPGLGLGQGMLLVIEQDSGRIQRVARGSDGVPLP